MIYPSYSPKPTRIGPTLIALFLELLIALLSE